KELMEKDKNRFKMIDNRLYLVEGDSRRLCIDSEQETDRILEETHDNGGHLGLYKTLEAVRKRFYWPNWSRDVKRHLKKCVPCQTKKDDIERTKEELYAQDSSFVLER